MVDVLEDLLEDLRADKHQVVEAFTPDLQESLAVVPLLERRYLLEVALDLQTVVVNVVEALLLRLPLCLVLQHLGVDPGNSSFNLFELVLELFEHDVILDTQVLEVLVHRFY